MPLKHILAPAWMAIALIACSAQQAHALQDTLARRPSDSLASRTQIIVAPVAPAAPVDTAALVLHNRLIFVFRAPLGATTATERAAGAARRIESLIESGVRDSVTTRPIAEGTLVAVGGRPVLTVTAGDADTLIGETPTLVAAAAAERLREALQAEVEQRSLARLAQSIALAIVATLLFLFALRLLRRTRAFILRQIPEAAATRAPTLAVRGFTLLTADQLLGFLRRLVDAAAWALGLFAAYLWLAYCLTRFPYSRPWGEALGTYLISTVTDLALVAVSGVPGIFTVVIILLVTRFVAQLVRGFFHAVEAGEVKVDWVHPETANPTRRIVTAMLWMFAIVIAYPYVPGSGSNVFKGVSVFIGLVLSLGSSGLMSQAMSGLVIMYSRALKPGDYVRIGEIEGTVTALGMLSTKVQSTKNEEITLPNAVIVGTATKNYSRLSATHGLSLSTTVTIGYDTPWRQVHAMLVMAAKRTGGLLHDPPPRVLQTALSDWYIEYELRAVTDDPPQRGPILSALHGNIVDVFNEYGVQIMSPNYEDDPPHPLVVPRDRWYAAPASQPSVNGDEPEVRDDPGERSG